MIRSMRRAIRIFNWHRLQENCFASGLQASQANYSHAEMGNNNAVGNNLAVYAAEAQGLQRNVSYALAEAVGNGAVQKNEWSVAAGNSAGLAFNGGNYLGGGLQGLIGHDGIPKFFKWDTAQGCMVAVELSTPFLERLARSAAAFLQSWRLG